MYPSCIMRYIVSVHCLQFLRYYREVFCIEPSFLTSCRVVKLTYTENISRNIVIE